MHSSPYSFGTDSFEPLRRRFNIARFGLWLPCTGELVEQCSVAHPEERFETVAGYRVTRGEEFAAGLAAVGNIARGVVGA